MNEQYNAFGGDSSDKKEENEAVEPVGGVPEEKPIQELVPGVKKRKEGVTPISELTEEQRAIAESFMGDLDGPVVLEYGTEGEKAKKELEVLFADFEKTYDLPTLFAINEIKLDDLIKHPIRTPAKNALNPMTSLLEKIMNDQSIDRAVYRELRKKFRLFSNAVGMYNSGRLHHDRVND
jgi:hypothetical protein